MDVQPHERDRTFNAVSPAVASEYLPQIPHRKHLSISPATVAATANPGKLHQSLANQPLRPLPVQQHPDCRLTVSINVFFCALAAYPLARLKFPAAKPY